MNGVILYKSQGTQATNERVTSFTILYFEKQILQMIDFSKLYFIKFAPNDKCTKVC